MSNEYLPLQTISRTGATALGGFCKWYYTPIENLGAFPLVNPVNQKLIEEPGLLPGKNWYGPVTVPQREVGWTEELQRAKAGIWYKQKVTGEIPGITSDAHINLENMAGHKFCIVGLARSGNGDYYIIGNQNSGLDLSFILETGKGYQGEPHTEITFTGESITRALLLPSFNQITIAPPPYVNYGGGDYSGGSGGIGGGDTGGDGGSSGDGDGGTTGGDGSGGGVTPPPTPGTVTTYKPGEILEVTLPLTQGSNTITVPEVNGKEIVFFARDNNILKVVYTTPTIKQVQRTANKGNVFTFLVAANSEEEIKILYKF